MSYSRWSSSIWYTYWHTPPRGQTENRDNAIFGVCGVLSLSAKELRDDMLKCLEEVRGRYTCTASELEELKRYMIEFLQDVNTAYPQ